MKHPMRRRLLGSTLTVLLGGVLAAAAAPPPPEHFGEATDVVAVEVPVQVVRDGQPVRGLTAVDFEVHEGRKKQAIVGFDVIDLAAPPATAATAPARATEVPAAARRHFLLLFDLSFSEPKSIGKAREAARDLVKGKLQPADLAAVATYSSRGAQLVLGFSPDRRQIDRAIDAVGLPEMIDRNPDPLKLVAGEVQEMVASGYKAIDNEKMLEEIEAAVRESERASATHKKAQVTALSRSFSDLARLMGSVMGRKYVIYLSEGFDSSVITGITDQAEIDHINESMTSGEFYRVDPSARYGNTEASNDLEKMLEELRRADCVIQSVDIGGLRGDDMNPQRRSGQDGLFLMAHDTGGELYRNFNDLGAAMDQMLQRTSVTYVLTLQPEDLPRDGSYRRLKVTLKDAPRGTRVIHRPGYYAPKPFSQQSGGEKILTAASRILSGEDGGAIPLAVLAAPFRQAAGDQAYVPVLIEVDGKGLLAGHQGAAVPAEIFVYALDRQGAVHDFQTQSVGLDVGKTGDALRRTGLKFFGHVDLAPGDYSLRVLVRNGVTGAYGMRVVPVQVPAFAQAGPVLLPPFFPEPAGRWVLVPEALPEGEKRPDYPFMLAGQPFLPANSPVLAPRQEARLELVGWNLGDGDLKATARVMSADGREVPGGVLALGQRETGAGTAPDRLLATFRPGELPPGEYRLAVQLTGAKATVTSAPMRFRVER